MSSTYLQTHLLQHSGNTLKTYNHAKKIPMISKKQKQAKYKTNILYLKYLLGL